MQLKVPDIRAAHDLLSEADLDSEKIIGSPPDFVAFKNPIRTRVRATLSENDILVSGETMAVVWINCGRCLENYELTLMVKFSQIYGLEQEIIDLKDEIRESLLIDLPAKFLCTEACEGLCPHCGANRNVNKCSCEKNSAAPRWGPLKNLKLQ
ncbi:MAG: DUF177 domain-containing protein [Elusimicrobia bacterium]|nr:DUF177 domain-containing protein [Candidatus Obscuribacterium magneticum]